MKFKPLSVSIQSAFSDQWRYTSIPQLVAIMAVNKDVNFNVYKMESKPRGIAVIINNEKFRQRALRQRLGTNKDAENLQKLFTWLGFDTKLPYKDLTGKEMGQTLEDVARMDHSNYDCLMVAILSHGKARDIVSGKSGSISIKNILEVFSDQKCPTLAGKPKIFIIQACRGKRFNVAVQDNVDDVDSVEDDNDVTDEDEDEIDESDDVTDVGPAVHPNISDYIVAYSTVPDHVSLRNSAGSVFITELEKKFRKHATNEDIITMLERVIHGVTKYQPRSEDLDLQNSRQSPEVRFSLKGKIYFNPSPDYS